MTALVVGLTGLPCSGKSFAARLLAEDGWRVIDADRLGHEALDTPEIRDAVAARFGADCLDGEGRVIRSRLGALVFGDADPDGLKALESWVHPWVMARVRERLARARAEGCGAALESAVLFAAGADRDCDRVWVVTASSEADRNARARARGWRLEELARRDARQRPALERALAGGRAVRVENDGTPAGLRRALEDALRSPPPVLERF